MTKLNWIRIIVGIILITVMIPFAILEHKGISIKAQYAQILGAVIAIGGAILFVISVFDSVNRNKQEEL